MPKLLSALLLLFVLLPGCAVAQQRTTADKYLDNFARYSPVNFYIDLRFPEARDVPDSLNVYIESADQLQPLLDHSLQNHLRGLEIRNASRSNLAAIFDMLTKFPNLSCLQIFDPFFSHQTDKDYLLPDNIKLLQQLKVVQLSNTNSLDMPDAINKISGLVHLEGFGLSGYRFPVATGLSKLDNISYMKLSTTNLEGANVRNAKWKTLRLAGTLPKRDEDASILKKISAITSLQRLYLEYCALGDGSALSDLKQLSMISLSGCEIDTPNQIFNRISTLKSLKTLAMLYTRDSTQVIDGVENLAALKTLTINLPSLAQNNAQLSAITRLKNLEGLSLLGRLTRLPDFFIGLDHLKSVSIAESELTTLPQGLFNLSQLEYLNASGNKLHQLPTQNNLKSIKVLNLSFNALTVLPSYFTQFFNIVKIDVSHNKLNNLPTGWQNFKFLKELYLSANYLTKAPTGIEKLTALEVLDLSENEIATLPEIPPNKYALRALKLSSNNLTVLPQHIGNYNKLEILDISGNLLNSLPESLGKCLNLKDLEASAKSGKLRFDADKPRNEQFISSKADSTHVNNIKYLPESLAKTKNIETLNLAGNKAIDGASIFNVLLNTPGKTMKVILNNDNIKQIPADPRWAKMTFAQLDLSYNKLTTLPAEFANATLLSGLDLSHNPLNTFRNRVPQVTTKADLKMLYDDLGIALPNSILSDQEYTIALCKRVHDLVLFNEDYERAIQYATKAMKLDQATYYKNIQWNYIGTARYFTNDYPGAIKDFDTYLEKEEKDFLHIMNFITPVLQYKAEAQLALGQTIGAAQTYEYWGKKYYSEGVWQQAAVLYKTAGDEANYKRLLDTALLYTEKSMAYNAKSKQPSGIEVLDYAELLIVAGRSNKAIEILDTHDPKLFVKTDQTLKAYLTATANYINNSTRYDDLAKTVTESVVLNGKPANWDYTMFNRWLKVSGLPNDKQQQLLSLQNIVK